MEVILKNVIVTQKFVDGQGPYTTIIVDPVDTLWEMGYALGLAYPQEKDRDVRVCLGGLPEMPALELQEDISYHGSPRWDTVRVLETNPQKIEEYKKFHELLRIAKERCAAKDRKMKEE